MSTEEQSVEELKALLAQKEEELQRSREDVEASKRAHDTAKQKLRKLEHMLMMAEKNNASISRQAKVTGTLVSTGLMAIFTMTPLCFLQLVGVISQGAFGYALAVLLLGASLAFLATMPTASRLVRFLGAVDVYVAISFASIYWILAPLVLTDVHCGGWDEVCDLVAIGMISASVTLVGAALGWATTIRLIPGSERVPLSQLRAWATPKLGRCLATVATFTVTPLIWAVAQPEDSFVLSSRTSLRRIWLVWRLANLCWGAIWTSVAAVAFSRGHAHVPVVPSLAASGVVCLLIATVATPSNRGRVTNWLGAAGSSEEAKVAALLSAVVGGMTAQQAFSTAQRNFSGIRFDALSIDDFGNSDLAGKEARDLDLKSRTTRNLELGQVDAFLSHSWRDDYVAKWAALEAWAANFSKRHDGASPMLWLDKACIDQQNISASLACLPVFLSGCKRLLIVAGSTYVHRLWSASPPPPLPWHALSVHCPGCTNPSEAPLPHSLPTPSLIRVRRPARRCVMEVFTFIYMGGDLDRITFLPIRDADGVAAVEPEDGGDVEAALSRKSQSGSFNDLSNPAVSSIIKKFASFDAHEAQCYLPDDKQMILGVIETGIGSIDAFNQLVRHVFHGQHTNSSTRRKSFTREPSRMIVLGMEKVESLSESLSVKNLTGPAAAAAGAAAGAAGAARRASRISTGGGA